MWMRPSVTRELDHGKKRYLYSTFYNDTHEDETTVRAPSLFHFYNEEKRAVCFYFYSNDQVKNKDVHFLIRFLPYRSSMSFKQRLKGCIFTLGGVGIMKVKYV